MGIVTHVNVDLDAAASVWAWQVFVDDVKPRFVPANIKAEEIKADEVALDLSCGLKGEKDEGGTVHSCFASIVANHADAKQQKALEHLVKFVDAQDAYGNGAEWIIKKGLYDPPVDEDREMFKEAIHTISATGINAVLRALQAVNRDDAWVCAQMGIIFDGMLKAGLSRIDAEEEADAQQIVGEVAIVRNSRHFSTNGILMERGAKFIVFVDGLNMGVTRRSDINLPTNIALWAVPEDEREEWYVHPAGFLTARGTRKAPASSPSKADPVEIAKSLNHVLGMKRSTS